MRLGQGPKAFLQIAGQSLLQHVVNLVSQRVGRILVAVPADHLELAEVQLEGRAEVHLGGTTRLATLAGLLEKSSESFVVIHDAARPFTSLNVLTEVIEAGRIHRAAAACRSIKVPVARVENGFTKSAIAPSHGAMFETPQAFHREVLERTFRYAREHQVKDEALSELAIRAGISFRVIADSEWNFKITTPLDWEIATKVVAPMLWPLSPGLTP
jgi:2-C-methyl-D-erythritol 4-phosphate cytidylyltransferase